MPAFLKTPWRTDDCFVMEKKRRLPNFTGEPQRPATIERQRSSKCVPRRSFAFPIARPGFCSCC